MRPVSTGRTVISYNFTSCTTNILLGLNFYHAKFQGFNNYKPLSADVTKQIGVVERNVGSIKSCFIPYQLQHEAQRTLSTEQSKIKDGKTSSLKCGNTTKA